MSRTLRLWCRFWLESVLAVLTFGLGMITILWRDWIEAILGIDPDRHSGALEWTIVGTLSFIAIINLLMARRDWIKRHALESTADGG
jgi:hypothetical protein